MPKKIDIQFGQYFKDILMYNIYIYNQKKIKEVFENTNRKYHHPIVKGKSDLPHPELAKS